MSQIIAATYEIKEKIGSGGAGIVYLGEHTRLGKPVVLKADKRTLSTKPEVLRREVDALKNLSHTYIPQVYDFVVEGDTVYTVMDYIEGESLDKPLKRGERFSQVQVIEWACELLEALCYLHSRPPHGILHSDIKPANIMVTPQGDVRLIDFNIALALGEAGSVRVGYSRGYASPEHYGIDYSSRPVDEDATELLSDGPTLAVQGMGTSPQAAGSGRTLLLDVRSDVYSLGATLYHLLGGQRPAQDAKEVAPLSGPGISPEVSAILQKAMAPDPDQRYQTAQEMLDAFQRLHENDPRTIRHRKRNTTLAAAFILLFLAGGLCTFIGLKQTQEAESQARLLAEEAEQAERAAKDALSAVTASEAAYASGDVPGAVDQALTALSLESPYAARAQLALTEALGVYDLSGGFHSHLLPALPSEPVKLRLSPEGTRAGAITLGKALVFDTETGETLAELAAEPSALSDLVFAGEDTVIYAGEGALRAYDLAQGRELWAGEAATTLALSADGSTVAAVYKDESHAVVYDAASGAALQTVDFEGLGLSVIANDVYADPEYDLFALNGDGTFLAAGFSNGALKIFDLRDNPDHLILYESSDFTRFQGGFYGRYFAYSAYADSTGENVFGVIDTLEKTMVGGFTGDREPYYAYADENGIYIALEDTLVRLDPATGEQTELAYTSGDYITGYALSKDYTIVQTKEGTVSVFDRQAKLLNTWETPSSFMDIAGGFAAFAAMDTPALRLMKLEDHADALLASYDPADRHSEARLSADGKTVTLFRSDGFRIYSTDGTLLADVPIPDAAEVYDPQFRRDGGESRLEVTYNDGLVRSYSAADGSLLSETRGEKPDGTLQEEFLTDALRIERPVHGAPLAYDRESGQLLRELEAEDYLTYVTQIDGYVITEYMDGQGERYGLLLDEDCETLARLPGLCDVLEDGTLVFDDQSGKLRQSRVYSIQELTALGEQYEGRNT